LKGGYDEAVLRSSICKKAKVMVWWLRQSRASQSPHILQLTGNLEGKAWALG
jgi:hypothetical protein